MSTFRSTKDAAGLQIIDPVLTNLALNYRSKGFAYDQIVSSMDVETNTGQYPVWALDDFMRDDVDDIVDERSETPEIDFSYSLNAYNLTPHRLKVTITNEERGQANAALRLEQTKLRGLMDRFAIRRERRLAAALRTTGNGGQLTSGATPSIKWDAGTTGSPATIEKDIKAGRKAVYDATGQFVDTMVLGWSVAYAIALDPSVREIIKYTVPGDMILSEGEAILPKTLHGLNVVIAGGKVNTARKGAATTLTDIWDDNVRLIKRVDTNAWGEPATVYSLRGLVNGQRPDGAGGDQPGHLLIDRWTTPDPPVDHVRGWEKVQEKVVAPDVGYEISDVLT